MEQPGPFLRRGRRSHAAILIDKRRSKRADKRQGGGGGSHVDLRRAVSVTTAPPDDLLALDEALDRLALHDSLSSQLVKLHYFAGLTVEQAAEEVLDCLGPPIDR